MNLLNNKYLLQYEDLPPCRIKVCRCEQCRYVKAKRKNRGTKRAIKRLINKRRRTKFGKKISFYWA
jgi:hypothetical protein